MNDDRFLDALHEGLDAGPDHPLEPDYLAARARRIARRRSARRVTTVTVPVLVVAAVVGALLAATRSSTAPTLGPQTVLRRVSAQVTELSSSHGVLESVSSADDPRLPDSSQWSYTDPRTGIQYDLMKNTSRRGKLEFVYWNEAKPLPGRRVANTALDIDAEHRTWTVMRRVTAAPSQGTVQDTARQIARALTRGRVTLDGSAVIDGRRALRLGLPLVAAARRDLYVDARTYRPIEEVVIVKEHGHTITDRLYPRPATAANVARVTRRPIVPRGYRQLH